MRKTRNEIVIERKEIKDTGGGIKRNSDALRGKERDERCKRVKRVRILLDTHRR